MTVRFCKLLLVLSPLLAIWFAFYGTRQVRLIHRQATIGNDSVAVKHINKIASGIREDLDPMMMRSSKIEARGQKGNQTTKRNPVGRESKHTQTNLQEPQQQQQQNKKQEEKPLFILHVGPPKTGTTTAQWGAARNEELLLKDNIHYLGHYGKRPEWKRHQLVWACTQEKEEECKRKWNELDVAVERLYQQHNETKTSAFLSEELLSHFKNEDDEAKHLWKYLVPILNKWHVRVVLTYRHFYDWSPSYYAQLNQPKDKKKHRIWPSAEGGKRIPTFPEYFDEVMELHFHRLLALRDKWAKYFPDVWVFNMHENDDYRTSFFCSMLPEAQHLCQTFQENQQTVTKNPSSSKILHHDLIAVQGYQLGWMHPKISRPEARLAVEAHATELGLNSQSDFPQVCLSNSQIQTLEQWSWKLESKLLAQTASRSRIKADIAAAVHNSSKFCSVDASEVLKDKKWEEFFKSLTPEKK